MLQKAFKDECMGKTQIKEWCGRFKNGRTCVDSDPRSGRPSTGTSSHNVERVRVAVEQDRRLTGRELDDEINRIFLIERLQKKEERKLNRYLYSTGYPFQPVAFSRLPKESRFFPLVPVMAVYWSEDGKGNTCDQTVCGLDTWSHSHLPMEQFLIYDSRSTLVVIRNTLNANLFVSLCIDLLSWPVRSPDLSPIVHVWNIIMRQLQYPPQLALTVPVVTQ
ncbi:hypothetical protein TNCV_2643271 [Trichonephila clavipes]|nr:hypothetical protein TNCV_2643271 [Trichonephila clavipes]